MVVAVKGSADHAQLFSSNCHSECQWVFQLVFISCVRLLEAKKMKRASKRLEEEKVCDIRETLLSKVFYIS